MSSRYGRTAPRRAVGVVVVAAAIAAGCSTGSDSVTTPEPTSTSVQEPEPSTPTTAVEAPVVTKPEVLHDPASVRIDVSVAGTDTELTGLLADSDDPFGRFVSCSGLRASYGSYSVLASVETGDVRSISVVSSDLVPDPGTHDAAVRVEFAASPPVDAEGTITIGDDRRTGSFLAFDPEGVQLEGTFDCLGGDTEPEPLVVGSDDGVLEVVEVFALLRWGDAQRILGLAAHADGSATVECPGAEGDATDELTGVRVLGDESIGAITSFELGDGPSPSMRLLAGNVVYSADGVMRRGADQATAGSFSADADQVAVDGAFRCS